MSLKYLGSLLIKSAQVQEEIERENRRRLPDWMRLLKLKKLRLAIRDRMQRIVQENIIRRRRLVPVRVRSGNRSHNRTAPV